VRQVLQIGGHGAGRKAFPEGRQKMGDLILNFRACGDECREDYLRELANDRGLPFDCVRRLYDRLGECKDFGALPMLCDEYRFTWQWPAYGIAS
jgi:hypothetical protein